MVSSRQKKKMTRTERKISEVDWAIKTIDWVLAKYEERTRKLYAGELIPFHVHPDYRVGWPEMAVKMRQFGYPHKNIINARLDWMDVIKEVGLDKKLDEIEASIAKENELRETKRRKKHKKSHM